MSIATLDFESKYLNGNTEISVILPEMDRTHDPLDFYKVGVKYKVLWLLHGTFGDHSDWLRKSNIERYACNHDLVVVMPNALNSDYTNWDTSMMGYSMYDYFIRELMPLVYSWLPVSVHREDNFIAGLSMGGTGALKYALLNPDKFAAAAMLSAGLFNPHERFTNPILPGMDSFPGMRKRVKNQQLNAGGPEAYINSPDNLWNLVAKVAKQPDLPRLYFTSGDKDFLYESYLKFKQHTQKLGLPAVFEEVPGFEHEWNFWDLAIQRALVFFGFSD